MIEAGAPGCFFQGRQAAEPNFVAQHIIPLWLSMVT